MNKRERRTWTPLPEQGQPRCSKGRRYRLGSSLLFISPPRPWGTVRVPTSPVCSVCKRAAQSRVSPFPSHRPPAHPPAKWLEGKPTVTIPVLSGFCQRRKITKKKLGGTHDCRWLIFFFNNKFYGGGSAQSCLIICDTMGCSLPGSSVHGILQARIQGSGLPFPSLGVSSRPRD